MNHTSQPSPLRLRRAQIEDCQLILASITELAEFEKLAHEVDATEDKLKKCLFGDSPSAQVTIAEWEGEPAGFALYLINFSTFLARPGTYLEDLFVRPAYRGRGIGMALLSNLARKVLESGGGRLEWSVLDWNESAIAFYEKLGATKMSDWLPMRLTGEALNAVASKSQP